MTEQSNNADMEETATVSIQAPAATEPVPTVSTDEKTDVVLVEMLMKTGASRLGAQTLIGKALSAEKQALFSCVSSEDNVLEIAESQGWRDTMTKLAQRLAEEQKASVETE